MSSRSRSQTTPRSLLAFAATVTVVGIAFSAAKGQEFGSFVAFGGVLLFVYALHRFGRSGPD
jgi:hypothetical protein